MQNEKVQNYKEFVESDQSKALKLISWLKQPTSEVLWPIPNLPGMQLFSEKNDLSVAPSLGQNTKQIMLELGYSDKIISELYEQKVIG